MDKSAALFFCPYNKYNRTQLDGAVKIYAQIYLQAPAE